jgi:hypothetical protein
MRKIFLTKEQLSRVVNNLISEGDEIFPAMALQMDGGQLPEIQGSSNQGQFEPVGPSSSGGSTSSDDSSSGGSTSGAVDSTAPNTGGGGYSPIYTDTTDNSYEKMYDLNISLKAAPDFKGPNSQYIPGAGDEDANLNMKGDFGIKGVSLDTMSGEYDIKVGDKFHKDLKKGKIPKRSKIKHPELHPNRHINKAKSKNVNHIDGITRGGVTFDTKFKPGTGADPFTVKTP